MNIDQMIREIKRHDLVIMRADKGNALVILSRDMYNNKVSEMLEGNDVKVGETFNFSSHVTVRWIINKSELAINSPSMKKVVLISNPLRTTHGP